MTKSKSDDRVLRQDGDSSVQGVTSARAAAIASRVSPSIVTVTKIDPKSGFPDPNPNWHAGFVIDERGYILTMRTPGLDDRHWIRVRLANQAEYAGELVATDPALSLAVLRIRCAHSIAAVPVGKARLARVGDTVFAVPSPAQKLTAIGVVQRLGISLYPDFPRNLIQSDIALPMGEGGSVMVTDDAEPIGIWIGTRSGKHRASFAVPLVDALALLKRTLPPPEH